MTWVSLIKILDLAKKLVNFMKKLVKNSNNFNRSRIPGNRLKKGEKLHDINYPKKHFDKNKEEKILFIKNNKSQNSTIDIEKLLKVLKTRDKKIEKLVFQLTNKID